MNLYNKRKEVIGLANNPYYHNFQPSVDSEVIVGTIILLVTVLAIVAKVTCVAYARNRKGVVIRARKAKALCNILDRDYTKSGRSIVMPSTSADYALAFVFGGIEAYLLYRFCHAGLVQMMLNIFGDLVGFGMTAIADVAAVAFCITAMWVYARFMQFVVVACRLHYHDRHGDRLEVSQRMGLSDILFSLTKKGKDYAELANQQKEQQKLERARNERAERFYQYQMLQQEIRQAKLEEINKARTGKISMTTHREKQRRVK